MAKGLLNAGLTKLNFSVQGLVLEVYWQVMRLRLDNTLRKIERFVELKEQGNYKLPRVKIVMLDPTEIHAQLPHIRQYWQARGLKSASIPLKTVPTTAKSSPMLSQYATYNPSTGAIVCTTRSMCYTIAAWFNAMPTGNSRASRVTCRTTCCMISGMARVIASCVSAFWPGILPA